MISKINILAILAIFTYLSLSATFAMSIPLNNTPYSAIGNICQGSSGERGYSACGTILIKIYIPQNIADQQTQNGNYGAVINYMNNVALAWFNSEGYNYGTIGSYNVYIQSNSQPFNYELTVGSWIYGIFIPESSAPMPSISLATPIASPPAITQGGSSTLVDSGASGSTAPFTYQWYEQMPGQSTIFLIPGATSKSYSFQTSSSTPPGQYTFGLVATAVNGGNQQAAYVTVMVNALTTTQTTSTTTVPTTSTTSSTTSTTSSTTTTTQSSGGIEGMICQGSSGERGYSACSGGGGTTLLTMCIPMSIANYQIIENNPYPVITYMNQQALVWFNDNNYFPSPVTSIGQYNLYSNTGGNFNYELTVGSWIYGIFSRNTPCTISVTTVPTTSTTSTTTIPTTIPTTSTTSTTTITTTSPTTSLTTSQTTSTTSTTSSTTTSPTTSPTTLPTTTVPSNNGGGPPPQPPSNNLRLAPILAFSSINSSCYTVINSTESSVQSFKLEQTNFTILNKYIFNGYDDFIINGSYYPINKNEQYTLSNVSGNGFYIKLVNISYIKPVNYTNNVSVASYDVCYYQKPTSPPQFRKPTTPVYLNLSIINYTVTVESTQLNDTVIIRFNGKQVSQGTGIAFFDASWLPAGKYLVQGKDIDSGTFINQTIFKPYFQPSLRFTKICKNNTDYNYSCTTSAQILSHNNVLSGRLYVNGIFVGSTNNTINYTSYLPGQYNFTFNTTGNAYYATNTIKYEYENGSKINFLPILSIIVGLCALIILYRKRKITSIKNITKDL